MGRPKFKLFLTTAQEKELEQLWKNTVDERTRERLLVIRSSLGGNNTYGEIADIVGCARSSVGRYVHLFEQGGFDGLLERGKPKPRPSPISRQPEIREEWVEHLKQGKFRTAPQLQKWLKEEHGVQRSVWAVYYWLKELGAKLLVPRPVHIKKDHQKAEQFPQELEQKLHNLPLGEGRPVRVYFQDEGRIGLHTIVRRAWGLTGNRIVIPTQKKYQWGYVFGALEVGTGRSEVLVQSHVSLESTYEYLRFLVEREPEAEHVIIWDGAGFHQKEGKHALPERVHVIQLPAYSPELNPIEKLWDIMKDGLCNRIFETYEQLEAAVYDQLQSFREDPSQVLRLLGNSAVVASVNAS